MATRDNLPQRNCDSDGKAENKRQRMVVWLIYYQSECQEEVILVNFPCASENVSCQWASVDISWACVALPWFHSPNPAQFLGDLRTRFSVTWLNSMLHLHERDVRTSQGFNPRPVLWSSYSLYTWVKSSLSIRRFWGKISKISSPLAP